VGVGARRKRKDQKSEGQAGIKVKGTTREGGENGRAALFGG